MNKATLNKLPMFEITKSNSGEPTEFRIRVMEAGAHTRFHRFGWRDFGEGGCVHRDEAHRRFLNPDEAFRVDSIDIEVKFFETNSDGERVYFGQIKGSALDKPIEVEVYVKRVYTQEWQGEKDPVRREEYRVEMYANSRNRVRVYYTKPQRVNNIRVRPIVLKAFQSILSED